MSWRHNRRGAMLGVSALLVLIPSMASAQPSVDTKRADELFDEGTKLMDAGRFDRACPALRESLAIDPAAGTALALARCYEKEGKIASAWTAYQDAETRARAAGQADREKASREQAATLAPRLPRLALTFGPDLAALPGIVLEIDGRSLRPAELDAALPIDPGAHVVELRAPGKTSDRRTIQIVEGETIPVMFSKLEDAPTATPPSTEAPPSGGGLRTLGFVVGGVGVVGLGIGSVFGLVAAGASSDSDEACAPFESGRGGTPSQYDDCVAKREDAGASADVSTVAFIAGGVLTAAGIGLVVFGGDGDEHVALELVPAPTSISARGTF